MESGFLLEYPILRVVGITKRFPGVLALDNVSLELYSGEIHSLLGENGSGKSTLAKIVAGIYVPDSGRIEVSGKPLKLLNPVDAVNQGIFYIPQSPSLIERLTVAENMLIALRSHGLLSRVRDIEGLVSEKIRKIGSPIDPGIEVSKLSYTQKQVVELVKASLLGAKVLLIDEVTTYLPKFVRETFYGYLKQLKKEGKAVFLITHKVHEAVEVADRVTIIRSGRIVRTLDKREFNVDTIRKLMFESSDLNIHSLRDEPPRKQLSMSEKAVIWLDSVWAVDESGNYALRGVELSVKTGEILGVVGISGNGQKELAEVLIGLRPIKSGRYYLDGVDITNKGPKIIRTAGIGFISETPFYHSLSGDLSLVENMALSISKGRLVLPLRFLTAKTREIIERYEISASSLKTQVKVLSGGNVMRFVIARELGFAKKALIALNPTRSLDERFALNFTSTLRESVRTSNLSVVYISESIDEVLRVSDTVAVINGGKIVGVFNKEAVERETLEKLMVA